MVPDNGMFVNKLALQYQITICIVESQDMCKQCYTIILNSLSIIINYKQNKNKVRICLIHSTAC